MKKEIREVRNNMVQITTVDERWYARPVTKPETGLPAYEFVPSVTWITNFCPKGTGYYKWLAAHGWDEAEGIKEAAGAKGTKVHQAVSDLIDGKTIQMDAEYVNNKTEKLEKLTLDEYECIMGFKNWFATCKPKIVAHEETVWNDVEFYAGSLDLVFIEPPILWIPDVKTSKGIYMSHKAQVSAYRHTPFIEALMKQYKCTEAKTAILQLGSNLNMKYFRFTEVPDCYEQFLAAKSFWTMETAKEKPLQRDYPLTVVLPDTRQEPQEEAEPAVKVTKKTTRIGKL